MNKALAHSWKAFLSLAAVLLLLGSCTGGNWNAVSDSSKVKAERGIPNPSNPPRLVNDLAGVFGGRADELERILVAFDDSTSNQITVVTVSDLGDYSVDEYALELGRKWGVGTARNNGVIVLVKPKTASSDGEVTIQVGYGLEAAITDVYAGRIIRNEMIPAFKEEDYYTGVYNACDQLMKLASGEISEPRKEEGPSGWTIFLSFIMPMVFFLLVLWLVHKYGGGANHGGGSDGGGSGGSRRPFIFFGSGWGGSSSSGGWGGGSSGGWGGGGFGGFGGGSFGGGGASGRW